MERVKWEAEMEGLQRGCITQHKRDSLPVQIPSSPLIKS